MQVLVILISFLGAIFALEDDSNEVITATSSDKSPINLDKNLRKALLKALVELENEEKENVQRQTRNDYVNIITHLDRKDKTADKESTSLFTGSNPVNMTITVKKTTSKPLHSVVVQKSKGIHKSIYGIENYNVDTPEKIITSASNEFASKSEKSKTVTGGAQLNSLTSKVKTKKNKFDITTTKPTSSTEESEANVESLQFFSAPLVAAFTVHQDEKGLPNSVVPIYNQANGVTNITEKRQEQLLKNQKELQNEVLKQQRELEIRQEEILRNRQIQLEEEIKRLTALKEEQEKIIKEQKFIYERKILEQQGKLYNEQTRLFNNAQYFGASPSTSTTPKPIVPTSTNYNFKGTETFVAIQPSIGFTQSVTNSLPQNAQILPIKNSVDFRTPFPQNSDQFVIQNSINPAQIVNSQSFSTRPISTFVPSVSLNTVHNSFVPSVNTNQLINIGQNPGVLQSLPSTQITSTFHQVPKISQNLYSGSQNLPFVTLQSVPFRTAVNTAPTHGTRSLREEFGTGNFVNNNNFNSQDHNLNIFGSHRFNTNSLISDVPQTTQFQRSNFGFRNTNDLNKYRYNTVQYSVDQPFLNQRFNNLLLHTGLGQGKQQENLNIVSKVLSLDHFGADSLTSNSNDNFKRIQAPVNRKVV